MGGSSITTSYPCGKMSTMGDRDSKKYQQMHFKVCQRCRDAITITTSVIEGSSGTRSTKHGGVNVQASSEQTNQNIREEFELSIVRK
jgi:hypothetical protein